MHQGLKRNGLDSNGQRAKVRKISSTKIMSGILTSPVKSQSDKKEYRLIKLPNGLTSLLVQHFIDPDQEKDENQEEKDDGKFSESETSDEEKNSENGEDEELEDEEEEDPPKEKMAAVALCIDVGSFQDPPEIQGLSHFLEHMIFMGSEKYPKENEFDQFVSTNGGHDNAMTECEYTMFYFEIVEEHLAGAINRFAELFVSPLMLRDSMDREMEAVESEFQNNINDDHTRIMQLCASIANGPASTFTWGNLKTLKEGISNEQLYKAVHEYRKKHYIANQMYLCVESSLSLDEQQKLIEDNFSSIQSGPRPERPNVPEKHFKSEFFEKVYYVKPKADKTKLFMTFLLPPLEKHYKSKPHDYLAFIIQHEGVGSLSSYLKQK
jgi:nardilysin